MCAGVGCGRHPSHRPRWVQWRSGRRGSSWVRHVNHSCHSRSLLAVQVDDSNANDSDRHAAQAIAAAVDTQVALISYVFAPCFSLKFTLLSAARAYIPGLAAQVCAPG